MLPSSIACQQKNGLQAEDCLAANAFGWGLTCLKLFIQRALAQSGVFRPKIALLSTLFVRAWLVLNFINPISGVRT